MTSRPLDFVQVNYSTAEREAERRLLPVALERGVAVMANRPFATGELVRRLHQRPLPSWAREIDCHTWSQVLLKFVISHPAITCAIPATSNMVHLRENLLAGEGSLPEALLRYELCDSKGQWTADYMRLRSKATSVVSSSRSGPDSSVDVKK